MAKQTKTRETTEPVAETNHPEATRAEPMVELEIANPEKTTGSVQYRVPGVAGTLRVARRMFVGTPPARLLVAGPLVAPDPEKAARARETAEEKAAKLEARIARAQASAAKTAERLARLRATLGVATVKLPESPKPAEPSRDETGDSPKETRRNGKRR